MGRDGNSQESDESGPSAGDGLRGPSVVQHPVMSSCNETTSPSTDRGPLVTVYNVEGGVSVVLVPLPSPFPHTEDTLSTTGSSSGRPMVSPLRKWFVFCFYFCFLGEERVTIQSFIF